MIQREEVRLRTRPALIFIALYDRFLLGGLCVVISCCTFLSWWIVSYLTLTHSPLLLPATSNCDVLIAKTGGHLRPNNQPVCNRFLANKQSRHSDD